jgi:hypothetical protein
MAAANRLVYLGGFTKGVYCIVFDRAAYAYMLKVKKIQYRCLMIALESIIQITHSHYLTVGETTL